MSFSSENSSNTHLSTKNPDGWYIYDGQDVVGPIPDQDFMERYSPQANLYASKKGFSRWYTFAEINQFFLPLQQTTLDKELQEFHRVFQTHVEQLKKWDSPRSSNLTPTTMRKVRPDHIPASVEHSIEQVMAQETMRSLLSTPTQTEPTPSAPSPQTRVLRQKNTKKTKKARGHTQTQTSATSNVMPESPRDLYLTLKGRLRLGQITSSFSAGFVHYFLTLSLSSFSWYRRLHHEMVFHITGKFTKGSWADILTLLPLLNCLQFYNLARLIQKAERQNQYTKTSPAVAALLGLFPPLAIQYLQDMANRHWMLHVHNVHTKITKNA